MKKLFTLFALFYSLTGSAQDLFTFTPFVSSRVHVSDSVQIIFQLVTNNPKTCSISVTQTAGATVKWTGTPSWTTGAVETYSFWLQGLAAGTYAFTAVGLSGSGTTGSQTYTLTVVPDPVCPVCPVVPPPRTVTGITISLFGVSITIPVGQGTKVSLSDGTTQVF